MDIFSLKTQIPLRTFDYQKLKSAIHDQVNERRFIGNLIQRGYIIRVKKGLYIWSQKLDSTPYSKEHLSNLIYGPSYVSLEYALSFHRLIPERVEVITAVTLKKKKEFETPLGHFSYEHLNIEAYSVGFGLKACNKNQHFMIASPAKALLDTVALRLSARDLNESLIDLLEKDLRIDMYEFKKIPISSILKMGSYYKASSVKVFCQWIKKEYQYG